MRSTLTRSKPAARASATARRTFAGSCVRPSPARTCGTIDCTPKLSRSTPARRYASSLAASTLSGLHSTVTSAPACAVDGVEDPRELVAREQRRRATAEEDARRDRHARGPPASDVGRASGDVGIDQMVAIRPRREVAVVTTRRAERDVDVDTELPGGRHAPMVARVARLSSHVGPFTSGCYERVALAYGACDGCATPGARSTVIAKPWTSGDVRNAAAVGSAPSTPAEIATVRSAVPVSAHSW